jgi:hypothetical protein
MRGLRKTASSGAFAARHGSLAKPRLVGRAGVTCPQVWSTSLFFATQNFVEGALCFFIAIEHRHGDFTAIREDAMDHPPVLADLDSVPDNRGVFFDELSNELELNV